MKTLIKSLLVFLVVVFISSCTITYNISVRENHSAHVDFAIGEENSTEIEIIESEDTSEVRMALDTLREFYSSDQISNLRIELKNGQWEFEFDIKNIDSLGNYLNPIQIFNYPIVFSHTANSLIITGSDGKSKPECDISGFTNLIKINVNLTFERAIKKIKTENLQAEKVSPNKVVIRTSIGEMDYSGSQNSIEVKLK